VGGGGAHLHIHETACTKKSVLPNLVIFVNISNMNGDTSSKVLFINFDSC